MRKDKILLVGSSGVKFDPAKFKPPQIKSKLKI